MLSLAGSADDLEDISNLDKYIARAKAVLIYCSDGCAAVALEFTLPTLCTSRRVTAPLTVDGQILHQKIVL